MTNDYYNGGEKKGTHFLMFLVSQKDRHVSYLDSVPERYRRKEYIIDKIRIKK